LKTANEYVPFVRAQLKESNPECGNAKYSNLNSRPSKS
jgi:hypothetical protein